MAQRVPCAASLRDWQRIPNGLVAMARDFKNDGGAGSVALSKEALYPWHEG